MLVFISHYLNIIQNVAIVVWKYYVLLMTYSLSSWLSAARFYPLLDSPCFCQFFRFCANLVHVWSAIVTMLSAHLVSARPACLFSRPWSPFFSSPTPAVITPPCYMLRPALFQFHNASDSDIHLGKFVNDDASSVFGNLDLHTTYELKFSFKN